MRATHYEIISLKYLTPMLLILFSHKERCKEVRVARYFERPITKYFAPISPILFLLRLIFKEVRETHFVIFLPNTLFYFHQYYSW